MKKNNWPLRLFSWLSSLQLTVIALLCLAVLVVWGTLYQVDNGIYAAQERFFRAWFVLIAGAVPFPAVKSIAAVLSVNLLAAAFRRRPVNIRTIGIIILHIGVAVLIGGSAIASHFVRESAITLNEDQGTDTTYDFTSWQLVVALNGNSGGAPYSRISRYDLKRLRRGQRINLAPTMTTLSLRHIYRNCGAMVSPHDSQTITSLKPVDKTTEEGRRIPGIVFSIDARDDKKPAHNPDRFVYAGSPYPVPFAYGVDTIILSLQPLALPLPVRITLSRFTAEWHPGTSKARSFQSRLRMLGKNIDREIVIEMNRPFRYRSFTFYQMGYAGQEGNYSSTLAIVKNPLRYLPYIASLIIVTGLFFHFIVKMWYELSSIRRNRRG
ncbi:MAG: cytochrome c biogenesis protein ResB [Chitinispirillaceae bacterium]|nr:cytochrome c biogenesis protein ResB [Chitinispirillaceae bacterium]